jgi:hypothetical protein
MKRPDVMEVRGQMLPWEIEPWPLLRDLGSAAKAHIHELVEWPKPQHTPVRVESVADRVHQSADQHLTDAIAQA